MKMKRKERMFTQYTNPASLAKILVRARFHWSHLGLTCLGLSLDYVHPNYWTQQRAFLIVFQYTLTTGIFKCVEEGAKDVLNTEPAAVAALVVIVVVVARVIGVVVAVVVAVAVMVVV
ncbi:hypothetical protein ElyMa_001896200 [Elysia marginata]|uniref:ABC transmembrane type-1 domain-containing protein n=1 Tax=Elysia marginata TaxID=1093978 RepID=A0AAV4EQT3_9GAST|nr:hypothetical protein ElyMa_001896200 [Elysia marginata]